MAKDNNAPPPHPVHARLARETERARHERLVRAIRRARILQEALADFGSQKALAKELGVTKQAVSADLRAGRDAQAALLAPGFLAFDLTALGEDSASWLARDRCLEVMHHAVHQHAQVLSAALETALSECSAQGADRKEPGPATERAVLTRTEELAGRELPAWRAPGTLSQLRADILALTELAQQITHTPRGGTARPGTAPGTR